MKKSYSVFFKNIVPGLLLVMIFGNQTLAQDKQADPCALFLFNFGKFNGSVNGSQFTFTILGDAGLANNLKQVSKNKKIKGKPVQVKECEVLEDIGTPQVLYVPASKSELLPEILDQTRGKPVKVVTDSPAGGGLLRQPNLISAPGKTFI